MVNLDIKRKADIVAGELKARMLQKMVHIAPRPGEEIVDTQHLITAVEQPLTEVRANKSSSARNENTPFSQHLQHSSLTPHQSQIANQIGSSGSRRADRLI